MNNTLIFILLGLVGIVVGVVITIIIYTLKGNSLQKKKDVILEAARKETDKLKRDSILETKEEIHKLKMEADKEIKEKKLELKETENRLTQREGNMDKRDLLFQKREEALDERESKITNKQTAILEEQAKIEEIKNEQIKILQDLSGVSKEEAKVLVMEKVKESLELEIANYIKERETEAKLECDKKAREMLVLSMQRYAADVAEEQTVTVVSLPNDEMKGRIIGREGRNIRTIEAITGVDLIIDDTPEAVVLSSFDPLRREIARITLETLIKDGRIHPTRIEELYDKTCKDVNQKIIEYGQNALFSLGLTKMESK